MVNLNREPTDRERPDHSRSAGVSDSQAWMTPDVWHFSGAEPPDVVGLQSRFPVPTHFPTGAAISKEFIALAA
jgi:hypothetical protein